MDYRIKFVSHVVKPDLRFQHNKILDSLTHKLLLFYSIITHMVISMTITLILGFFSFLADLAYCAARQPAITPRTSRWPAWQGYKEGFDWRTHCVAFIGWRAAFEEGRKQLRTAIIENSNGRTRSENFNEGLQN